MFALMVRARVVNQKNREKVHKVLNLGSDFAMCDRFGQELETFVSLQLN